MKLIIPVVTLIFAEITPVAAMQIVDYSPEKHDRFAHGYSSNPVETVTPNTSPAFLGAAYDLSGVPWNAADRRQSFVFLSRKHYLFANHFGPGSQLQFNSQTTGLGSASRSSMVAIPDSDIGIARLTSLIPATAAIANYPLLDLPTTNSYIGRDLWMYGWFARLGKSKVSNVLPDGRVVGANLQKYLFEYEGPQGRPDFVTLEGLDSGSPSFIPFDGELTLTGNHFYIIEGGTLGGGDSFLALPVVIQQLNAVLAEDGFALRFRSEPVKQWTGTLSSNWGSTLNWNSFGVPSNTQSLGFAGSATNKTVSLSANRTVKGIVFPATENQPGYTFQAGSTLTLGYVGIRNDAPATQTFDCALALDTHQHWTAARGDIQIAGTVQLNANFLNLSGNAKKIFFGPISGTGGISIQQGITQWNGSASYSGPTYLYGGELHLSGAGQLPPTAPVVFAGGKLRLESSNQNTGTLRLLDHSQLQFSSEAGSITWNASAGESWAPDATLTVVGFDAAFHQITIGDSFDDITPAQRAAILFDGIPAFYDGDGRLRPATPLEQWQLEKFPQEAGNPASESDLWGPQANPSGDGVVNLLKYALNLDPWSTSAGQLPQAHIHSEGYLEITIPRNPRATDITFRVEVSENLKDWFSGENQTITIVDEPSLLVVRDATLLSESNRRFIRLVVE